MLTVDFVKKVEAPYYKSFTSMFANNDQDIVMQLSDLDRADKSKDLVNEKFNTETDYISQLSTQSKLTQH